MHTYPSALMLGIAALALAAAGWWLTARELSPYQFSFAVLRDAAAYADAAPAHALSLEGNRVLLDTCARGMQGVSFLASPTALKTAVAHRCLDMAGETARLMPTYSYAHYVSAMALLALYRAEAAEEALLLSHQGARNEQWIAELRVALAEDNAELLGDYIGSVHRLDLAMLVQSRRGIRSIAHRYVASPDFRSRVTDVVETLPPDVQARFVQTVRSEANALLARR
ncbi:hypothetical protein [Pelagibacterium limicola]|uniref:hypothetical protein n=1 Tax=Pelagibacterium limicola TaxID=2791022 RepID=UPI0018B012D3|nr:hypothetical protein [Pelagibacterium limicola]